jgi:hypothetical protein
MMYEILKEFGNCVFSTGQHISVLVWYHVKFLFASMDVLQSIQEDSDMLGSRHIFVGSFQRVGNMIYPEIFKTDDRLNLYKARCSLTKSRSVMRYMHLCNVNNIEAFPPSLRQNIASLNTNERMNIAAHFSFSVITMWQLHESNKIQETKWATKSCMCERTLSKRQSGYSPIFTRSDTFIFIHFLCLVLWLPLLWSTENGLCYTSHGMRILESKHYTTSLSFSMASNTHTNPKNVHKFKGTGNTIRLPF